MTRRFSVLPACLSLAAMLAISAPLRAEDESPRTPAELRRGAHLVLGIGPNATFLLFPFKTAWGVAARALVNFGVSDNIDFRAGFTADASGSYTSYMGLGATAAVRVNLGSVYSFALGGGAGMLSDTKSIAPVIGPEWSILTLRFGSRGQVELGLDQGIHFHMGRGLGEANLTRFQSAVVLTYLFLDRAP